MKTAMHGTVDGYEIILGFSEATVDPVATQNKCGELIKNIDEWKQIEAINAKIAETYQGARDDFLAMFGHSSNELASQAEANYFSAKMRAASVEADAFSDTIAPLYAVLEKKKTAVLAENAVYFTPGELEDIISETDAADLSAKFSAATEREQVTLDGKIIADNRNITYWTKSGTWKSIVMSKLGDVIPAGSIEDAKLTDSQRAEIASEKMSARIAKLTADEKAAELKIVLESLANQAVAMDAKSAITGDEKTGAAWYAAHKAIAEAKYK